MKLVALLLLALLAGCAGVEPAPRPLYRARYDSPPPRLLHPMCLLGPQNGQWRPNRSGGVDNFRGLGRFLL